jgi:peptidyl-prolyl cis-trans isomerase SurA
VLEQMITEQTQLEYANNNGIRVDDHDLDLAIADLAKQNKLDVKGLQAQLAKEGVPFARFREEIRREIILARLKNNEIGSRINVTDSEVDQVLKSAQSANRNEYHWPPFWSAPRSARTPSNWTTWQPRPARRWPN